jgi:hypothetical protein
MLSRPMLERVRRLLPDLRLVLTIRNPVERSFSHHLLEASRFKREKVDSIVIHRALRHFERYRFRARSNYPRMIRNYSAVFGNEALLIQKYDELSSDPDRYVARVLAHIGADPDWRIPDESRKRIYYNQPTEMPGIIRWYLADQWIDSVRELDRILDGQVTDWVQQLTEWQRDAAPSWRWRKRWNRWVMSVPEQASYTVFENIREMRRRRVMDAMFD